MPQTTTSPLHPNPPFPGPKHKHALLSTLLAQCRLPKGSARAPPPLLQARRERFLPRRRSRTTASSGCQAWRSLGRPCADGEGAATALPKGCFRSSAQRNGVRRLFLKQSPSTGARPGPPGQRGEPTRWRCGRAPLPIPGVPQTPPAPAVCPPPFCAQPLRHRYNSRPGSHRRDSGAPRYGLPPSSPLLPTRQPSDLCLPD